MGTNQECRVAIVGAGISGLSLAYYLEQKGIKATIFDEDYSGNASSCSQGVATSKGLKIARSSLFQAKLDGNALLLEMIKDISSSLKLSEPLYKLGVYEPFISLEDFQNSSSRIFKRDYLGAYECKLLDLTEPSMQPSEQALSRKCSSSFYYCSDFFFNTEKFLSSLVKFLENRGISFVSENVKIIEKIDKNTGKTNKFRILEREFSHVFLCCSTGVNALLLSSGLKPLGFKEKPGMTIEFPNINREFHGIKAGVDSINFLGGLRVGSYDFKGEVSEEIIKAGTSYLLNLLGRFLEVEDVVGQKKENFEQPSTKFKIRSGRRLSYKNRSPFVGSVDNFDEQWKNLWIISGFHKSGYALAPYIGKLLSQNFPENLGAFTHPLVSDGELNIS